MKTNGINVFFGKEHATVNAEITFTVKDNPAHLSLILEKLLLDQLREHDAATLSTGKYRLSLTMCASSANNITEEEVDEVPPAEDK